MSATVVHEAAFPIIREGDRGPAVEDVQRRLLSLGYDLGPTGVDGVFLGETLRAVRAFQEGHGLAQDGLIGHDTWSALVDETFMLGDRLLYLRVPHFHGRDVRVLQGALNALGFASGVPDGIFGTFAERAVREFQRNVGLPPDGIAGMETVHALSGLRHVWADKDPTAPVALMVAPARAAEVLSTLRITVLAEDDIGGDVARRFVSVATAACEAARVGVALPGEAVEADLMVHIASGVSRVGVAAPIPLASARPEVGPGFAARVVTALAAAKGAPLRIAVDVDGTADEDERALQRVAVGLLDGVCAWLAEPSGSVLP